MSDSAGFDNLNLDLMFALPCQDLAQAAADLDALIDLGPEHISYYQLTLEPHTPFHAQPPAVPDLDLAADMAAAGLERLEAAGYSQYEVSAYAQAGRPCRHNLNYWHFGDYLGIGAGAHGKLTDPWSGTIRRTAKHPRPATYLGVRPEAIIDESHALSATDLVCEFALNAFRLTSGFEQGLFESTTGLPWSRIASLIAAAVDDGLLTADSGRIAPTDLGRAFANELIARFMID